MTDSISEFAGEDRSKLPTGLNVLTILTIIGSIFALLASVWTYYSAKDSYEKTKEAMASGKMDDAPSWAKGMLTPEMLAMQQKMLENRLPILIVGLVGAVLCLYGAIEMRKRKKQGYIFWLIGEILPIISMVLFVGTASLSGFGLFALLFPVIFIILYTVNRKELIY